MVVTGRFVVGGRLVEVRRHNGVVEYTAGKILRISSGCAPTRRRRNSDGGQDTAQRIAAAGSVAHSTASRNVVARWSDPPNLGKALR
jgi:ethanolamine utilization protein EutA (predicted chaperonin)